MIAIKPFSRKVGGGMVKIIEGKEVPKLVLASYTKEEIQELKDKKIIGDSVNDSPVKKSEQKKAYNK